MSAARDWKKTSLACKGQYTYHVIFWRATGDRRQGGYFEIYLNPWDYAAGILLIQGAGGQITDFTGKSLDPRKGSSVVGTNGYVHAELLKILLNG
ncbi:inositol monophosphatase family protein [Hungatella sp.]|uniref:inositol monophosphatase family protein n=1 Tax=Hungatella sp. TaxID=2613924 RepID=UPI0032E37DF4